MTCKEICIRYKAASNNYANGHKRCQVCELFMLWKGLRCPCCHCRLRTKPRNVKFRRRLMTSRKMVVVQTTESNELQNRGYSVRKIMMPNTRLIPLTNTSSILPNLCSLASFITFTCITTTYSL